ncbi:MAG TPA: rod shape-determining protein RodA [Rectinema sp.]|jgi:rod shape determining protein RodA|nr:rod shape-determining protein RodA [Spirochaetia bacterium]MDI9427597.1 rod shape-determining protein RodA [Spirochaetota bacterium]OQC73982.1 MAG: Rod shape-determining protein RodA [Spirochaetes bacterium ADurb.Bin001]HNP92318.1 rod shape-determining protein RodA [Rectinema sp.]HNT58544.1 rod shape-determining protein RodA [Rectinema sp.]
MKFQNFKRLFGDIDYYLLFSCFLLCALGIIAIYSSGIDAEGAIISNEYLKQILWFGIGIFLLIAAALFDFSRYKDIVWVFFAFAILLLIITLLAGRVVNGARSWLGIGGIGIQPAEFTKVATVLMLARYLESAEFDSSFKKLLITGIIMIIPLALILAQPDFGSALVFVPAALVMLTLADVDFRYILFGVLSIFGVFLFLSLPLYASNHPNPENIIYTAITHENVLIAILIFVLVISIISGIGWLKFKKRYYYWFSYSMAILAISMIGAVAAHSILKPYQIMRLLVFIDPSIDPKGSGWNILQSITAIGSGGFLGKGFLQGTHSHARYIPQQSTDFIFSIIAEEFGFIGCTVLFILYGILFFRCVFLIETCKDRFSQFVIGGLLGIFAFHFMINIGMAMGIMPVTGIPLYFVSYGGSSLWTGLISIGILTGISARRYSA